MVETPNFADMDERHDEENPAVKIQERKERSAVVVSLTGKLDGAGAPVLEARISQITGRGDTFAILDCSRLVYINSAGLRSLVLCARMCHQEGGSLVIADLQPSCRKILGVSGLLTVLDHHETTEAALAAQSRTRRPKTERRRAGPERRGLEIEVRKQGSAVVVSPIGRLNGTGAVVLEARIGEIVGRDEILIVLDCAGMSYINSSGLRCLLLCARTCQQEGGKLVIASLRPACRAVVDMSGFLSVIDYHETSQSALAALTGGSSESDT